MSKFYSGQSKTWNSSENPYASIDAGLRDWDVLHGLGCRFFGSSLQIVHKARSVVFLVYGAGSLQVKFMRRAFFSSVIALLLGSLTEAQTLKPVETIPVSEIHAGMHGVAYTVFQGTKPESMGVEVLGILKNANGPKGDIILVRLSGEKAEYTGVVGGMSGSPVYLDGKLAGALAFRIGEFSKEPIAGVTPIAEMLEISALDQSPMPAPFPGKTAVNSPDKTSAPGIASLPSS